MYEAMKRELSLYRSVFAMDRMPTGGQDCGVPGSVRHRGKKKGKRKGKKKRK